MSFAAAAAENTPRTPVPLTRWTLGIRRAAWSADHAGMPTSGVAFRAFARRACRWVATGGLAFTHPPARRDDGGPRRETKTADADPANRWRPSDAAFFSEGPLPRVRSGERRLGDDGTERTRAVVRQHVRMKFPM